MRAGVCHDGGMARWTCPHCNRTFGKTNQSHTTCEPAPTLEEFFAAARPFEKPIFDAIYGGLKDLDGLIVDPLSMGILLKNGPMFAELRTKTRWVAVGFHLGRRVESGRFSRKVANYGKKHFHVINMTNPAEVDDELMEWLLEAYHLAGGTLGSFRRNVDDSSPHKLSEFGGESFGGNGGDGMVPNDVDIDIV